MILLDIITIKTVKSSPFYLIMVDYHIFPLNYHILCFQKVVQNYLFPQKIPEQFIKNV